MSNRVIDKLTEYVAAHYGHTPYKRGHYALGRTLHYTPLVAVHIMRDSPCVYVVYSVGRLQCQGPMRRRLEEIAHDINNAIEESER